MEYDCDSISPATINIVMNLVSKVKEYVNCCRKTATLITHLIKKQREKNKFQNRSYWESGNLNHMRTESQLGLMKQHLDKILREKQRENAVLRETNQKLRAEQREKCKTIKNLDHILSSLDNQICCSENSLKYKEKVEEFNVEIQKLKKQLAIELKRYQKEQKIIKRIKSKVLNEDDISAQDKAEFSDDLEDNNAKESKKECAHKNKDDDKFCDKTPDIINSSTDSSIFDEILEEPEFVRRINYDVST
ncbi:uncharacterized protein LOC118185465 [Stegodyphus dumicola]|uniref:uncharacterized protein LOC118185465 n=1 Tax=Stegodyphus dumicola TaxID=202533 RepID=UPI0015A9D959|nr:uncharacterized protein LOC118185465 [Stegodyphus dumicola]